MTGLIKFNKQKFNRDFLAILFITAVILLGYHEIFLGANFFTFKDPIGMSDNTFYTPLNGWRPDIRFGVSFFFGDPGMTHPWSLFSLWEKIAPSREFAYNFVIVLFGICSAISLYFFLRKIAPGLGRFVAILSPLVIFCQGQLNSQYARGRCSISTGVPLLLMLLYHFYQRPRMLHFLLMGLLFWFVAFFGSLLNLTQTMMVGFLFTLLYTLYFRENVKKMAMRFLSAYSVAGLTMICLGLWIFYSFFWEYLHVTYMREKVFSFPSKLDLLPNLRNLCNFFIGLLQVEWLPTNLELPGISWRPVAHFFNVAVIMPLISIFFIFRRSENFWEFALKWLVVISITSWALTSFFPTYASLQAYASHKSSMIISLPLTERAFFPLQIGLLALFFSKMKSGNLSLQNVWIKRIPGRIYGTVACVLSVCYMGLLLFSIFSILLPDFFPTTVTYLTERFIPSRIGEYPKDFLLLILPFMVKRLASVMNGHAFLFYLSSLILILLFAKNRWLLEVSNKSKTFIPALLLLNGIMFSWTVYPLNYKKSHFEEHAARLPSFNPTDRFYHVRVDLSDLQTAKTTARFKNSWIDLEGEGEREYILGEEETPGLNLSSSYSFEPNDVGHFIYRIFNAEKNQRLTHIRNLAAGPLLSSPLLDMSAVNYYYSLHEMPKPPQNLSLIYRAKQLYIYKNNSAWPYFYLAKNLEILNNKKQIQHVKQGTAYIEKKDSFILPQNAGGGIIKMKEFLFGKMVFDFESRERELLVIADSWHPLWRAKTNNGDLPVIKANDIFKGIILPPGKYDVTVFFDNSPYLIGIYLSIISWTLFLVCFVVAIKFNNLANFPQFHYKND